MNEYLILDVASSAHTAFKAGEDPEPQVLITTENNGETVSVIGINPQRVAGLRRYFESEEWRITARQTDTPLDLWASRSENTMLAKRGNLDAEGDELALEAAEDIRDALEAESPEEEQAAPPTPGQVLAQTRQPPEAEQPEQLEEEQPEEDVTENA